MVSHVEDQVLDDTNTSSLPVDISDVETAWQEFWTKYGEMVVWQGWVAKYPDHVDYDKLTVVPSAVEVEISTEADAYDEDVSLVESGHETCEQNVDSGVELVDMDKETTQTAEGNVNQDEVCSEGEIHNSLENEIITNFADEKNSKDYSTVEDKKIKETDQHFIHRNEVTVNSKNNGNCKEAECNIIDATKKGSGNSECDSTKSDTSNVPVQQPGERLVKSAKQSDNTVSQTTDDCVWPVPSPRLKSSGNMADFNQAIESTMRNRTEQFMTEADISQSDSSLRLATENNQINENTELVHMMHSYAGCVSECSSQASENQELPGEGLVKVSEDLMDDEQTQDCDQMWQELWDEHYTEIYWYHCNRFAEWFNQSVANYLAFQDGLPGQSIFESEVKYSNCNTDTDKLEEERKSGSFEPLDQTDDTQTDNNVQNQGIVAALNCELDNDSHLMKEQSFCVLLNKNENSCNVSNEHDSRKEQSVASNTVNLQSSSLIYPVRVDSSGKMTEGESRQMNTELDNASMLQNRFSNLDISSQFRQSVGGASDGLHGDTPVGLSVGGASDGLPGDTPVRLSVGGASDGLPGDTPVRLSHKDRDTGCVDQPDIEGIPELNQSG